MDLFKPVWNKDDGLKRYYGVQKIIDKNDQKILVKIATESKYADARFLAAKNLNDLNLAQKFFLTQ